MSTTCCHFGMSQKLRKWLGVDSKPNTHHLDTGETTHLRTMDLNKPDDTSWVSTLQADGRWHNSPLPVSIRGSNILFLCTANVLDTIPGWDVTVILLCPFQMFCPYLDDHCGMCFVEKFWCNNFDSNDVIPVVPKRGSTKNRLLILAFEAFLEFFHPPRTLTGSNGSDTTHRRFAVFGMSQVGWVLGWMGWMGWMNSLGVGWGYDLQEKMKIAEDYLVPSAMVEVRWSGGEKLPLLSNALKQPCGRLAWNRRKRRWRRQQRRRNGSVFGRRSDTWKK